MTNIVRYFSEDPEMKGVLGLTGGDDELREKARKRLYDQVASNVQAEEALAVRLQSRMAPSLAHLSAVDRLSVPRQRLWQPRLLWR